MMKVYLVSGDNDEDYSDYVKYNLEIFSSKELAETFIENHKEAILKSKEIDDAYYDKMTKVRYMSDEERNAAYEEYMAALRALTEEYGFEVEDGVVNYHTESFYLDLKGE